MRQKFHYLPLYLKAVLMIASHADVLRLITRDKPKNVCIVGYTNDTFSATGEIRNIHDHIDCNSENLIYMLHFLRCNKQYIGETKRRLKDRFNEHRRPVDRPTPSSRPTAVSDHFLSDNHSPNDIEELIHSSRDALCKAREVYLIERGQTPEP